MVLIKNKNGNYDVYVDRKQLDELESELWQICWAGGKYIYNDNDLNAISIVIMNEKKNEVIGIIKGQTAIILNTFLEHSLSDDYPKYEDIETILHGRLSFGD